MPLFSPILSGGGIFIIKISLGWDRFNIAINWINKIV